MRASFLAPLFSFVCLRIVVCALAPSPAVYVCMCLFLHVFALFPTHLQEKEEEEEVRAEDLRFFWGGAFFFN
jgi:hypothetical protein